MQPRSLGGMWPPRVSWYGCPYGEGPLEAALRSVRLPGSQGQLDVRVTVFEMTGMPGIVGALSESAEMPVAVAE